jgi:hypothetical protein
MDENVKQDRDVEPEQGQYLDDENTKTPEPPEDYDGDLFEKVARDIMQDTKKLSDSFVVKVGVVLVAMKIVDVVGKVIIESKRNK